jgi:hypothetical protein
MLVSCILDSYACSTWISRFFKISSCVCLRAHKGQTVFTVRTLASDYFNNYSPCTADIAIVAVYIMGTGSLYCFHLQFPKPISISSKRRLKDSTNLQCVPSLLVHCLYSTSGAGVCGRREQSIGSIYSSKLSIPSAA